MSEERQRPTDENAEAVRKLVTSNAPMESEEGKRNPIKTERDLNAEIIAKAGEESVEAGDTVRKSIVPDA